MFFFVPDYYFMTCIIIGKVMENRERTTNREMLFQVQNWKPKPALFYETITFAGLTLD